MKIISAFLLATMGYAACLDCTLASSWHPKPKRSEIGLSQVNIESPKPKRSEMGLSQVRIESPKPKRSEMGLSQVRIESPKPKRSEIGLNQVAGPNLS